MSGPDNLKKILGIPCGCDNRREIMGSGNWQTDAIIVGSVGILIIGVLLFKYTDLIKVPNKVAE